MKNDNQEELIEIIKKDNLIIESLVQWTTILYEGKSILEVFSDHGYKKIMIYGYGQLGKLLERQLKGSNVHIECIMDKKFPDVNGYYISNEAEVPSVDAVIITNTYYYTEIKKNLLSKGCVSDIRLLDEILFQL